MDKEASISLMCAVRSFPLS